MKTTILTAMFAFSFQYGISQDSTYKMMEEVFVKGTIHPKGRFTVTEKVGSYTDPNTGRTAGLFRMIYTVDTLSRQLINIVTIEKVKNEHVTIFYFNNRGMLAQVATGTKKSKSSKIDNLFTYTEEENRISDVELNALSEGSEKYDLLRTSRRYALAYKIEKNKVNAELLKSKDSTNHIGNLESGIGN